MPKTANTNPKASNDDEPTMDLERIFARFANATAKATGSPAAFLLCVLAVVVWAASGPIFKFSETWQLVINTGTTIITFLMVFLIQNTQNRDGVAIQTKLDELIRSSNAEDEFMGIEKLTDKELEVLHERCESMASRTAQLLERSRSPKPKSRSEKAPRRRAPARRGPRAKSA